MARRDWVALFFADAHLDRRPWAEHRLEGDSAWSFLWLCKAAAARGRVCVFSAGDHFDSHPPCSYALQACRDGVETLANAGCPFYFIQGQPEHDAVFPPDPPYLAALHGWCQHLDRRSVSLANGCRVYGLDFRPLEEARQELAATPADTDLLVAHQVWQELMGSIARHKSTSWSWIAHAKTLITGDYHKTVVRRLDPGVGLQGQLRLAISPGATCMRRVIEPFDKFAFAMRSDGSLRRVLIPTRRWLAAQVGSAGELTAFLESWTDVLRRLRQGAADAQLPAELRTPAVVLDLLADDPSWEDRIRDAVGESAHLFVRPFAEESRDWSPREAPGELPPRDSWHERLSLCVDPDDPAFPALLEILSAASLEESLLRLRSRYFEAPP